MEGPGDLAVSGVALLVRSRIEGGSAAAAAAALLVRSGLGEMGMLPERLAVVVNEGAVSPATDLR